MVDVTSISHAMTATKAMKDILEAMVGLRDANTFQTERFKLQSLIIDAQNSIFSANEERSALLERVRDLEKTIAEFETWDTEKQRYELKTIAHVALVYAMKKDADTTEPAHWLCANCYNNRKKSFFQYFTHGPPGPDYTKSIWECATCKAQIRIPSNIHPGNPE